MQCAKFEQRLQWLLDERIAPECDSELISHAESCDACRNVLWIQKQLFDSIKSPVDCNPSSGFPHVVLDRCLVNRRRSRRRRFMTVAIATAALLLLAILPFAGNPPEVGEKRGTPRSQVIGLATVAPHPTPKLNEADAEELRVLIRYFLGELSQHRSQALEPVDHLAEGFRPLTVSFNVAIDALLSTLPGQRLSADGQVPQARLWSESAPVS